MPGHDGLWLAGQLRREHPDTAVIIATGLNDVSVGGREPASGRRRLPDQAVRARSPVPGGIPRRRVAQGGAEIRGSGANSSRAKCTARRAHLEEVIASQFVDSDEDLDILLATLTATNLEAYSHACRVAALAVEVARSLDISGSDLETIERGALLHDIGKLAMPEAVLRKPAPLTAEEHAAGAPVTRWIGHELIRAVAFLVAAGRRWFGTHRSASTVTATRGRRGDDVCLGARIVAVADAYDTMTRARVFRDAIAPEQAIAEITSVSGTQFDSRAVAAFLATVDKA